MDSMETAMGVRYSSDWYGHRWLKTRKRGHFEEREKGFELSKGLGILY